MTAHNTIDKDPLEELPEPDPESGRFETPSMIMKADRMGQLATIRDENGRPPRIRQIFVCSGGHRG